MIDASKSIEACAAYYGDESEAMKDYLIAGEKKALLLKNRGTIAFEEDGSLSKSIRDAYSKYGFFIFEGALNQDELEDIKIDLEDLRSKFPTGPESSVNSKGEPAMNAESKSLTLLWSKPLGDRSV